MINCVLRPSHRLAKTALLIAITGFNLLAANTNFAASNIEDANKDEGKSFRVFEGVDLVSTLTFQYARPRIVAKSVFPQLRSDSANEPIDGFNQLVTDFVQQKVDEFKLNVSQNQAPKQKLPKSIFKNDLYIDFATSFVQSGNDPIISIRFNIQGNIAGLAHPYHHHYVLNYDLESGEALDLEDLFKPNSNYLQVLSDYTSDVLRKRHLRDKSLISEGTAPRAENFKNWNIKPNGLLITFDEYQVASYVEGAQTVLVPYSALTDVIDDESPLAGCILHKKRCLRSNVLTGGFIDEAANKHRSTFVDPRHGFLNPSLSKR